jgi:hypothetical protein
MLYASAVIWSISTRGAKRNSRSRLYQYGGLIEMDTGRSSAGSRLILAKFDVNMRLSFWVDS